MFHSDLLTPPQNMVSGRNPNTSSTPFPTPNEKLRCIVVLNPGIDKSKHLSWLASEIHDDIKLDKKDNWKPPFITGYVATFDEKEFLLVRGNKDVAAIEEEKVGELDGIITQ